MHHKKAGVIKFFNVKYTLYKHKRFLYLFNVASSNHYISGVARCISCNNISPFNEKDRELIYDLIMESKYNNILYRLLDEVLLKKDPILMQKLYHFYTKITYLNISAETIICHYILVSPELMYDYWIISDEQDKKNILNYLIDKDILHMCPKMNKIKVLL